MDDFFDDQITEDPFRERSREEERELRHAERSRKQKSLGKIIGENMASYALLLIFVLLVGFIWTEIGIFKVWTNFAADAAVTIVLYILADICASHLGAQGGKFDADYLKYRKEYVNLLDEVRKKGIALMNVFCDWQIDVEYEFYIRKKCKDFKLDYNEFMRDFYGKSAEEIQSIFAKDTASSTNSKKLFGLRRRVESSGKAAKIIALNKIKRIELTPDILLTDGKVRSVRGGVPMAGEEYISQHTTGVKHIIMTVIFAVFAAIPTFAFTQNASIGMVIYTLFKITLMIYRMYVGYSRGAKGYNTIEPKHLQAKIKYLYLYLEFINNKVYETLGEKYSNVKLNNETNSVV